ncbi:MAG TPA: BlaI/MecI/CopY family transcriptional regulator [Tepidisphaeraceae bacterium]|nr:BlaI/MecI/CopY family transcriptional regulator [Tepidisphaeraceae bacterium]
MPEPPSISDAEWEVMNVVWDSSPITSMQIVSRLSKFTDWNPRTIKTLINRLVRKGALAYDTEGNRYLYRPAVGRAQCVGQKSRSFAARVFGGAVGPMLCHFVAHADLTPAEIEELQRILTQKGKRRSGKERS